MRGTVAKRCRKILYAMQVKDMAPTGTEYRINKKGEIRAFGARSVYQGMKQAYKVRGGFVAQPSHAVSKRAQVVHKRCEKRESKRYARQRRRKREQEAQDDLTARLAQPVEVPQL